jgi:hypothetical protein
MFPSRCLYGSPVATVLNGKLVVSCPEGGEGASYDCTPGHTKPRVLEDGSVVASCTAGERPRVPSPEPLTKD